MNSLFEIPGLEPIVIQIISYLDVESFLKVREVNKTLLHLIDNELSLWRNALKNQMRPIDMTKIYKCDCNSWWENASKPFLKSLKALKLLVPFIFELQQRHFLTRVFIWVIGLEAHLIKFVIMPPRLCWN